MRAIKRLTQPLFPELKDVDDLIEEGIQDVWRRHVKGYFFVLATVHFPPSIASHRISYDEYALYFLNFYDHSRDSTKKVQGVRVGDRHTLDVVFTSFRAAAYLLAPLRRKEEIPTIPLPRIDALTRTFEEEDEPQ